MKIYKFFLLYLTIIFALSACGPETNTNLDFEIENENSSFNNALSENDNNLEDIQNNDNNNDCATNFL
jgi:hypothetical protein